MMRGYPKLLLCAFALLAGASSTGCAGISRPSDLRPASHPLLEGVAARTRLLPLSRRAPTRARSATRSATPAVAPSPAARSTRATIIGRLATLEDKRRIANRPATDMGLLRAAFDGVDGARSPGSTMARTRRTSRAVARPRPGDLAFFDGAGGAAEVAVVRAIRRDGTVEAVAVTRGAVRAIVLQPDDPHTRRRAGRIVNTFLRARRPGDDASAVYLAGQLFIDFRTLLD